MDGSKQSVIAADFRLRLLLCCARVGRGVSETTALERQGLSLSFLLHMIHVRELRVALLQACFDMAPDSAFTRRTCAAVQRVLATRCDAG